MSSSTLIFHVFHDKKVGPHRKVRIGLIYKGEPLYKYKKNSCLLDNRTDSDTIGPKSLSFEYFLDL